MKCIHLDFHTSPAIDGIGTKFNKAEFTKAVKEAKIDLMTVFAKCHHGYCYYPTKVGTVHPGLKFNLLKEQIEAIHDAGAEAPIYITMGWSKLDADEHPEWHHIDFWKKEPIYFGTRPTDDLDTPIHDCTWTTLCPVGGYKQHLIDITHEVCQQFDTKDGVFYDICFMRDACACESCKAGMKEMGLDPDNYADAQKYYRIKRIELMKELTGIVHQYTPGAPVFYNGGADQNRPEYHPYQTHYELEDLPTAWGGYDLMPLRAKFFEKYGKKFWGMTGKFHHAWGEFGGFKNKDALKYECADMVSIGASISVGDHLHPLGKLDDSTYAIIGHAFDYTEKIEKYSENTKAYTDIGIWMSHNYDSDMGASKMVQIMHLEFDVIESGDDISKYKCIILPDCVKLSDEDKKAICDYVSKGGAIVASGNSGFKEIGIDIKGPSEYDLDYISCDMEEITTPFLSYTKAYVAECKGEVLAKVYEPYFNRTFRHFCGHKNTPFKEEPASYPALVKNDKVIYFAHPVFAAYNSSGNYVLERYIKKAVAEVYEKNIEFNYYPSCARVRVRKSEEKSFYAVHMLYAPPINRGNVCLLEDFPPLYNTEIKLSVPEQVNSVTLVPQNKEIPFVQKDGKITFNVEKMELHQLIVLNY